LSVYVDPSILVSFFANDDLAPRADRFFQGSPGPLLVSDLAGAEFASAISRLVRMRELGAPTARRVLVDFDAWVARVATLVPATGPDIVGATSYLRRLDLNLRTADAIHIAIAQRVGSTLATFDDGMARSAETLGLQVTG
jgi:predicted nucleic acid-binding protein